VKFAYADPPYIGQAKKHYGPEASEVNHFDLVSQLYTGFDAWALSCSSTTLLEIGLIIDDYDRRCRPRAEWESEPLINSCRIGGWFKPFASFKPGVNPAYCWEPVIFYGGKPLGSEVPTVRDYVSANITLQRGTHGAKPDAFWFWLFQMLGAEPGDEFTDLFPGSKGGARCWGAFCRQASLLEPVLGSAPRGTAE